MQPKINNEIFRELIKCTRSGFFSIVKPESVVTDKLIQIKNLKKEMAERVVQSLKAGSDVRFNFEVEHAGKISSKIDCMVAMNGKTEMYCCFPVNYKITKYEIHQAAYSYYVATLSGIKIEKIIAVRYKNGKDKPDEYSEDNFYYSNITGSVISPARQKTISAQLSNIFRHVKLNSTPKFSPHHYCIKPFVCPLKEHCFEKEIGKIDSIFDLSDTKFSLILRLFWKNILRIEDIERKEVLPSRTEVQIEAYTKRKEVIDRTSLYERYKHFTKNDDLLILDIDYCEVLNEDSYADKAINKLPFVFNLHFYKSDLDSTSDYFEFINKRPNRETAEELIRKLISFIGLYDNLKILIYNKNKVFSPLQRLFDENSLEYHQLSQISNKVFDLYEIFLNKEYCHPSFKGSAYLKIISKITSPGNYLDTDVIKNGIQLENYFKANTSKVESLTSENIQEIYRYLTKDVLTIINTHKFLMSKL